MRSTWILPLFVLACNGAPEAPQVGSEDSAAGTPPVTGPSVADIASVGARIEADAHKLHAVDGGLRLANPRTDLDVRVSAAGARLGAQHDDVAVDLVTRSVRRGSVRLPLEGGIVREGACDESDPRRDVDGACLRRAEVVHGTVAAWWSNPSEGLRQGWTIEQVDGSGELVIEVGSSLPVALRDGAVVLGDDALVGRDLRAWDADGDALALAVELTATGFELRVAVDGADWPVHVDPTWSLGSPVSVNGVGTNEAFGSAIAVGDVNGDGTGDLVVGSHQYDLPTTDMGRVYVFLGPTFSTVRTITAPSPAGAASIQFGYSVALGNFNGDARMDLAVGAPLYDSSAAGADTNEGGVMVYTFDASGIATLVRTYDTNTAAGTGNASNAFGFAVAWGDVNNDSSNDDDLIVGCPRCDTDAGLTNNRGRVFVFRASAGALPASGGAGTAANLNLFRAGATADSGRYGSSVAAADLNRDGVDEVYGGCPGCDPSSLLQAGEVYGFHTFSGTTGTERLLATGTAVAGEYVGGALAVGDYNGDGGDDLVIGTSAAGVFSNTAVAITGTSDWTGRAVLVLGTSGAFPTSVTRTWTNGQANSMFGASVAMGDVNADGFADVVVGAPRFDDSVADEGSVAFYMGKNTATTASPDALFTGGASNLRIGERVGLGNTDADASFEAFVSTTTVSTSTGTVRQLDLSEGLDLDDDGVYVPFDCLDTDALVAGQVGAFTDGDGDAYGIGSLVQVCPLAGGALPLGYALVGGDCNDSSASVNPGAVEAIGGPDVNCSGTVTCFADLDDDGYRTTGTVASADTDCADSGEAAPAEPAGDCDDSNALRNPGRLEIVDNGADEDCSVGDACFADADADGYHNSSRVASLDLDCLDAGEAGASVPAGDCDDTLNTVNPGVAEVPANNRDNDCDGREACYADADSDGAARGVTIVSNDLDCTDPGESQLAPGPIPDCNDFNPAVKPGAFDVPGNGVDEDCSGSDAFLTGGGDPCDGGGGLLSGVNRVRDQGDFTLAGQTFEAYVGASVASGDFDGDGDDDLAVGVPGDSTNGFLAGKVLVWFGPLVDADLDPALADVVLLGPASRNRTGWSVANAGQTEGFGTGDSLLIGTDVSGASVNGAGLAYLVFASTLAGAIELDLETEADAVFNGGAVGDQFGLRVAGIGDHDGDGFDDVAVAAPTAAAGGFQRGAVYVWLGPVAGSKLASSADVVYRGGIDRSSFGRSVAGLGNSDGIPGDEIAIGAPRDSTSGVDAGAAFVWSGGAVSGTRTTSTATLRLFGRGFDRVGASVARAGDVDLDGSRDLWVGARTQGSLKAGATYLVPGDLAAGTYPVEGAAVATLLGSWANDTVGSFVVGDVDLDNDSRRDVVIGGERATGEGFGSGNAWLAYGPFRAGERSELRTRGAKDAAFPGVATGDLTGSELAVGDVDDDGFADVVVASWNASPGATDGGQIAIFRGGNDPNDYREFYADSDADGFGNAAVITMGCVVPDGYAENDRDCDDASDLYYPGAPEACAAGEDFNCDGAIGDVDFDGDGATACGGDCDENDAEVGPGNPDLCGDGVDNDCDGTADGATAFDALTFYADVDGDGYGFRGAPIRACSSPFPDLILVGGDCNDVQPTVNPAAFEVCDSVDNDCDNAIDEGASDATSWYRDGDLDGHGDPLDAVVACVAPVVDSVGGPATYVASSTDCDDGSAAVGPGRPEVCDLVDNDCSGAFYLGGPLVADESWTARVVGAKVGTRTGAAVARLPDLDGDGGDEVALGFPSSSQGAQNGGAVVVRSGWIGGGERRVDPTVAAAGGGWRTRIVGTRRGGALGASIATGDVNGDGSPDLVVGAPGARVPNIDQGAVYVFLGPLAAGSLNIDDASFFVRGRVGGSRFGASVAVGDHDGDGYDDLLVGAPGEAARRGAAYLVYGRATFEARLDATLGFAVGEARDAMGISVAFARLDADSRAEAVIGAPGALALDNGHTYVVYGSSTRIASIVAPSIVLVGAPGTGAGVSVAAAGDVNDDNVGDLIVGSSLNTSWLVLGRSAALGSGSLDTVGHVRFVGGFSSAAGRAVAGVGDVDGDGFDDLLLGSPDDDAGGRDSGAAYLVYGRSSFTAVAPGGAVLLSQLEAEARVAGPTLLTASGLGVAEGARIIGRSALEYLGEAVAGGDFDGDGFADLLVGAPAADSGGLLDSGYVATWRGGRFGVDVNATDAPLWWQDLDADGWTSSTTFRSCPLLLPRVNGRPQGLAAQTTPVDCLDTNDAVHPCELELDGDATDSNCDGSANRVADFDGDGLSYTTELALGTCGEVADTDGDGIRDDREVFRGSDPLDPISFIYGIEDLQASWIRISELMIDPAACADSAGEYVELHFTGPARIDLGGLTLFDATGSFTLSTAGPLLVNPGQRIVLATSASGYATCYGSSAFAQTGLALGNSGDRYGVRVGGTTITEVDFTTGWTIVPGFAFERDDVDDATWCLSADVLANGDRGSPGSANGLCSGSGVRGLADVGVNELTIGEILVDPVACSDADGEYVEVRYAGSLPADLGGLRISDANGNTAVLGPTIVGPGSRILLARSSAGHTACYGEPALGSFGFGLDNTGDRVVIGDGTRTFDTVDFQAWTVSAGVAFEQDDTVRGRFCLAVDTMANGDLGTRGLANGACPIDDFDGDGVVDAAEPCLGIDPYLRDSDADGVADGTEIASGTNPHGLDGDPLNLAPDDDLDGLTDVVEALLGSDPWASDSDGDSLSDSSEVSLGVGICVVDSDGDTVGDGLEVNLGFSPLSASSKPRTASALLAGDLVITEIMADPSGTVTDELGEYFEVRNATAEVVVLHGLTIADADGNSEVIDGEGGAVGSWAVLPAGARRVFARSGAGASGFASTYGAAASVVTETFGFGLNNTGDTVTLRFGSTVVASRAYTGASVVASRSSEVDDTDPNRWCAATDLMGTSGNYGTPGAVNGTCPIGTVDSLGAGDLVITEFLADPDGCGGDTNSEYFEVVYVGLSSANLKDLRMSDSAATIVLVPGDLVVNPGDRLLFARSASVASCYGVTPTGTFSLALNNTPQNDLIRLSDSTETLAEVDFRSGFVMAAGRAFERSEPLGGPATWCYASNGAIVDVGPDAGTPGRPNGTCPTVGSVAAPQVMLSEVSDDATGSLRYVEVFNYGTTPADLSTVRLQRYTNGANTVASGAVLLYGELAPGEAFAVGKGASSAWVTTYGVNPDAFSAYVDGTNNDAYALAYDDAGTWRVFDHYGPAGVDFAGGAADYGDKAAIRSCTVRAASGSTSFTIADWLLVPNSQHTLGWHDDACRPGTYQASGVPLTFTSSGTTYACPAVVTATAGVGAASITGSIQCSVPALLLNVDVPFTGTLTDQRDGTVSLSLGSGPATVVPGWYDSEGTVPSFLRSNSFSRPYQGIGTLEGELDLEGPN